MGKFIRMLALAAAIAVPYLGISSARAAPIPVDVPPALPKIASVDNPKWQVSAEYFHGFNNVEAGKTIFTSDESPEQEHNLSAGWNGARVGAEREFFQNFIVSPHVGANVFYGKASDSANRTYSSGTEGLEGTADFDMEASEVGVGAYIGEEFNFLRDRLGIGVHAGVDVAKVKADLTGRGYVTSPSGDFASGNTLESEVDGLAVVAKIGGNASVYLDRDKRFKIFAGASYGLGNKLDWEETKTDVRISAAGQTTESEGRGETSDGYRAGAEVYAGFAGRF